MVKKQNYSRKRQAILEVLQNTHIHPTAEWVYQSLKTEYPDLSLGTVYRNLSQFKQDGAIISMGVVNGQERFDCNVKPHSHFICNHCKSIIDIEGSFSNSATVEHIEQKYGFSVVDQKVVFYGICHKCKEEH